MAELTKYRGKAIPTRILQMDAGKDRRKQMKAFKEWVDLGIEIEAYPNRYYYITNPDTGEEIELDFMKAKITIHHIIGSKKVAGKGYTYPDWVSEKQIREIDTYSGTLIGMKLTLARRRRGWETPDWKLGSPSALVSGDRDIVIRGFAKGKTIEEMSLDLSEKHGTKIPLHVLRNFRVKNLHLIEKERAIHEKKQGITPLVEAEGRVQKLAYLYNTNERKYEEQNYPIPRATIMLKILEQIRKEIEGDKIVLDINGKLDIDLTVNVNQTFNNLMGQMPLMSFIVAIVAAKKGVNPTKIMSQLQRSIYSMYSGVSGVVSEGEQQDLTILPSNQVYDWLQLKNTKQIDLGSIELEVQNKEEEDKVNSVRDRLLSLVNKGKD